MKTVASVLIIIASLLAPRSAEADEPATMAKAVEGGAAIWETIAPVKLHSIPHKRSRVVGQLRKGIPVVVLMKRDAWVKVLAERGKPGWIEVLALRKVSDGKKRPPVEPQPASAPTTNPARSQPTAKAATSQPTARGPTRTASKVATATAPKGEPKHADTTKADKFVTPIDFCATRSQHSSEQFTRQKLLLFRMTKGANATIGGPGSRRCLEHAAGLFQAVFPMKRFDNVVSPTRVPPELKSKNGKPDLNAIAFALLKQHPFIAYSLKCTDYVAVPVLTRCEGVFKTVKTKKGSKTYYDAKVAAKLVVWRKKGDALVHHATIEADAPTLANRMSDLAQQAQAGVAQAAGAVGGAANLLKLLNPTDVVKLVSHISATPSPTCLAKAHAKPGSDPACKVSLTGGVVPFAQPIAELRKCLADPPKTRRGRIRCGIRNRAEQLAFNLQKEARGVDGWRLWAAMKVADGQPVMKLGKAEGVYVGEVFKVVRRLPGGDREELGHAKVVEVGAGGDAGGFKTTELRWRAGEANGRGVILEEHPQLGLAVGAGGGSGALLVPVLSTGSRLFDPGTAYGGGLLTVGYDFSGKLGWTEFWLMTNIGLLVGPGAALSTVLVDIQVLAEKRFYLGRRIDWFFGLGPSMVIANLVLNEIDGVPAGTAVHGFTIGVAAQTGFDLTLTADFCLRLGVMWRQHFKAIDEFGFKDDAGVEQVWKPLKADGSAFSTTYSGMVAYLGGVYVF